MKVIAMIAALGAASPALAQDNKALVLGLLSRGLAQQDRSYIMENVAEGYIQHNPVAADGRAGLLGFVDYIESVGGVEISPVRVLGEGDLVMVQSAMRFGGDKVVFDLFRLEDGQIAEHWDAITDNVAETVSGRSMLDGPTKITDLEQTAANKALVLGFVEDVLVSGRGESLAGYLGETYAQHNPQIGDGLEGLGAVMGYLAENDIIFAYTQVHNVVAEGNFVFVQSEGQFGGAPMAFYDLFRVDSSKIVEHWDVVQPVPDEMAHENGMF